MINKIDLKQLIENCPKDIVRHFTNWFTSLTNELLERNGWVEDNDIDVYSLLCKLDLFYVNWSMKNDYFIKTYKAHLSDSPLYNLYISKIINIFDCSHEYFIAINCPDKYSYKFFPIPVTKNEIFNSLFGDIMVSVNYEESVSEPEPVPSFEKSVLYFEKIVEAYCAVPADEK